LNYHPNYFLYKIETGINMQYPITSKKGAMVIDW